MRAIRLCKGRGFRGRAQTNVHRGNLGVMLDTVKLLDSMGVEEVRVIRTTETPRWNENGRGICLGLQEYYEEMLALMGKLVRAKLGIQADVWQFAYSYPGSKTYYFHPVQAQWGQYRDSIPQCRDCQYWPACMGRCRAIALALTQANVFSSRGGYMKRIDGVFAAADPEYRCGDNTGSMARKGGTAMDTG